MEFSLGVGLAALGAGISMGIAAIGAGTGKAGTRRHYGCHRRCDSGPGLPVSVRPWRVRDFRTGYGSAGSGTESDRGT